MGQYPHLLAGMAKILENFKDSPYLSGMASVALATGIAKDCLNGRYFDVQQDLEDVITQAAALKDSRDLYKLQVAFLGGLPNDALLDIHKGVTSNISLYDTDDPSEDRVISQRSPDGQFFFGSGPATVVIEVAYSQDEKLLSKAAREYIYYSLGEIKAVLCFSLNKFEGSTVPVWKPRYYPEQGSDQLVMKTEQVVLDYQNSSIKIPYSKLYHFLIEVEQLLETSRGPRPKHGVKRRCMSPDSDESMTEKDKRLWRVKDRAKKDRQIAEDGEYEGSHDGEERLPKRRPRECRKSAIVELDSNDAVLSKFMGLD
ncbi:hypothetical protein IL306_014497 [Fusarium sp. DS 682]|nr:hypothetical protein IL306_014497 [Fusarium sp. DS 682]